MGYLGIHCRQIEIGILKKNAIENSRKFDGIRSVVNILNKKSKYFLFKMEME